MKLRVLIDFNDPVTVLSVGVPIIGGITASVYYINKLIQDKKDRKPTFSTFQRKKENSVWFIHLHSPNKPIRKCNIIFKGEQLSLRGEKGYEKSVPLGGGCNFDMPSDVSKDDDGFVIVREEKKKLEKEKFNKMETPDA